MALDPRIALGVQPLQVQSPMEGAQQMLTLRELMMGAQAQEARRDQYRLAQAQAARQQQADQAFRAGLMQAGQMTPEVASLGLAAGYSPTDLQSMAGMRNWGRPKVAGQFETVGPDGRPVTMFRDEFGGTIGEGHAKPVELRDRDIGGSIQSVSPFTGEVFGSVEKTNSPDAILTDQRTRAEGAANRGVTIRGQNMADARAADEARFRQQKEAREIGAKGFEQENALRDDYLAQSKEFIKIRDSYSRIKAAAQDPSAAGDIALIFSYMKVLDPTSVVREGEFATAQNAGGVDDKMRALYNQVLNGQRLAPNVRADFVDRANKLFTVAQKDHGALKFQVQKTAREFGLNPDRVTPSFESADPDPSAQKSPMGASGGWSIKALD